MQDILHFVFEKDVFPCLWINSFTPSPSGHNSSTIVLKTAKRLSSVSERMGVLYPTRKVIQCDAQSYSSVTPSRPRCTYFATTSLSFTFASSGSWVRVLILTSRVTGDVTISVTGDGMGIVVRGVLGLASPSPSAFFRATLSCSDLDFG
jgi:hypothetical protein